MRIVVLHGQSHKGSTYHLAKSSFATNWGRGDGVFPPPGFWRFLRGGAASAFPSRNSCAPTLTSSGRLQRRWMLRMSSSWPARSMFTTSPAR